MVLLPCGLVPRADAAERPLYEAELIFPLETWHNHASCIVVAPDGDLLVCWFHGSGERTADDVKIESARLRRGNGPEGKVQGRACGSRATYQQKNR